MNRARQYRIGRKPSPRRSTTSANSLFEFAARLRYAGVKRASTSVLDGGQIMSLVRSIVAELARAIVPCCDRIIVFVLLLLPVSVRCDEPSEVKVVENVSEGPTVEVVKLRRDLDELKAEVAELKRLVKELRPDEQGSGSGEGASSGGDSPSAAGTPPAAKPLKPAPSAPHPTMIRTVQRYEGHTGRAQDVAVAPDGKTCASIGGDGIRIWNLLDPTQHNVFLLPENRRGQLLSIDYSPDGKLIAVGGSETYILRAADGEILHKLDVVGGWSDVVRFSRDGKRLATTGHGLVQLWDRSSGDETAERKHEMSRVTSLDFAADGRVLCAGGNPPAPNDCVVRLWDVASGKDGFRRGWNVRSFFRAAILTDEDSRIIAADGSGEVHEYDVAAGTEIRQWMERGNVSDFAVTKDRKYVATAEFEKIRLWKADTAKAIDEFPLPGLYVKSISLSDDGRRVAFCTQSDNAVRVATFIIPQPQPKPEAQAWSSELKDWKPIAPTARMTGHTGPVTAMKVALDGTSAISLGSDGTLRQWDLESAKEIRHAGESANVDLANDFIYTPDGDRVMIARGRTRNRASVLSWNVQEWKPDRELVSHEGGITCLALNSDGSQLATGGLDSTLRLWDVSAGNEIERFKDGGIAFDVAFAPDDKSVAEIAEAGLIIRSLDAEKKSRTLERYGRPIAFAGDPNLLLVGKSHFADSRERFGSTDFVRFSHIINILDLQTDDVRLQLRAGMHVVKDATWSPDGKRILAGYDDGVRLWDATNGRELLHVPGRSAIALSRDGKIALTVDHENRLCVWDVSGVGNDKDGAS